MAPSSLEATPMERPMPQQLDDLSRSRTPLEQDRTIMAVIEMSQASWLVAGLVPGIEARSQQSCHQPPFEAV